MAYDCEKAIIAVAHQQKKQKNKYQLKIAAIHKDLTINSNFYCGF